MLVIESELNFELENVFILEFGTFYFFENFIISEINKEVLFNWELAETVINLAYEHYGENPNIAYVSNRIHNYSLVPQDWLKFFSARHVLKGMAVVTYTKESAVNVVLEKLFFSSRLKKFTNLVEAANWANALIVSSKDDSLYL